MLGRDPAVEPLSVRELCQLYSTYQFGQRHGRGNFDRMYRQFWQQWADRRADSITRKEVRLWHASLSDKPSHANHGLAYLKALYNWGLRMELIDCLNPRHRPPRGRERFLSV